MNAQAPIVLTPAQRLREIVAECVATTDSRESAAERLLSRVRGDAELWGALLEPWERRAANDAIGGMIRHQRATVWQRPAAPDARVVALANMTASLLDFRLPSGVRLRNATADEVAAAAEFYRKQSNDMSHKARWLSAVADRMGDAETVGDALTETALRAMQDETNV